MSKTNKSNKKSNNTNESTGLLKMKDRVLMLITAAVILAVGVGLPLGFSMRGENELKETEKEYKESAIYQKLMEEDTQRITDAYKNKEINLDTYSEEMNSITDSSQWRNYIKKDYEENKEFQSRVKSAENKMDGALIALGAEVAVGMTGTFALYNKMISQKYSKKKKESPENTHKEQKEREKEG